MIENSAANSTYDAERNALAQTSISVYFNAERGTFGLLNGEPTNGLLWCFDSYILYPPLIRRIFSLVWEDVPEKQKAFIEKILRRELKYAQQRAVALANACIA